VDTADVNQIRIGLGDPQNPVPGGSGNMYFDDIRLYLPKCVPWLDKPAADFSNNCLVDLADVGIMADEWLRSDTYLSVEPPPSAPVGWWKLDGDAADSSASGYHGTAEGSCAWVSGYIDGAIEFTGGGRVLVTDDGNTPLLRPADRISSTAWINYSVPPSHSARVVVKGLNAGNRENFALQVDGYSLSWFVRDANRAMHGIGGGNLRGNEWAHIAGVYDGSSVTCYLNGQLANSEAIGAITLLQDANCLSVGDAVDGAREFIGVVDDVEYLR